MCRRLSLPLCSVCAGLRKPVHALARLSSKVQLTFLKLFIFKGIYLIGQLNTSFLHLFFFFLIFIWLHWVAARGIFNLHCGLGLLIFSYVM